MHGPLHEISLIEVLQLLGRGHRSGVLRVVGPDPDAPRILHLHRGQVAAVEPDAGDAALDHALRHRHLLASDDSITAVPLADREQLREQLARSTIEAMMHWPRGRFDFTEGPTTAGPLAWTADLLVLALVDDESRRVELGEQLHQWHGVVGFAPVEALGAGERVSLEGTDWRILDAVDGVRNVAAIAAVLDEPLELVGARIRALETAAILQVHPPAPDVTTSARMALASGEYDAAATQLRQRVQHAPRDAEAWRTLGLAEVGAGRFEQAVDAWRAWQQAAPERRAEADALIDAARTMMEALHPTRD
jgi:tetratricopeptide (TPR) repeat protein